MIFLGHQAGLMVDAIGRTLYRLAVSRKNLLEWTTAAQAESKSHTQHHWKLPVHVGQRGMLE